MSTPEIQTVEESLRMRIAELDMEIHERQVLVEELRKFLPPDEEQDEGNERPPVPAKPRRKKAESAGGGNGNGNGKPAGGSLAKIRAALLDGPLQPAEIEARTDLSRHTINGNCRASDWFEKAPPGHKKCPWQLTEAGKAGE